MFEEICARDLEGIVAKHKRGVYKNNGLGWKKIKNPKYSQAEGRHDLFHASEEMNSIKLEGFDIEKLRERLRKMSDKELREFGTAARHMVSPKANMGKPPLPAFVLQLEEARAEWRRRLEGKK